MVAAGLKGVNIGIEHCGCITTLRGWIDRYIARWCGTWRMGCGFVSDGLPAKPQLDREDARIFPRASLSYAEFKVATPFPGTPLFEMAKHNKWIENVDIEQFTSYTPTMRVSDELDPDYLKSAASRAYRSFYTKPRRLLKELSSMSFLSGLVSVTLR